MIWLHVKANASWGSSREKVKKRHWLSVQPHRSYRNLLEQSWRSGIFFTNLGWILNPLEGLKLNYGRTRFLKINLYLSLYSWFRYVSLDCFVTNLCAIGAIRTSLPQGGNSRVHLRVCLQASDILCFWNFIQVRWPKFQGWKVHKSSTLQDVINIHGHPWC